MKAIQYHRYGSPDELNLEEVYKPSPGDEEVLIKIYATSLNSSDYEFLTASPVYARMWGLLKPKYKILGSDIAGRVEAVGKKAKQFQPGDEVFGDAFLSWGGLAEFVCVPESKLIMKPTSMTFQEAAAVPQAGVVAMQGLRDKRRIQPGQKVLINGAGGGAGSFAIQLAKLYGAEVSGVDSTEKLDMMSSLGADHVIDYKQKDFTKKGDRYDRILDLVASHSIFDYERSLNPEGIYLMVGGSVPALFQTLIMGSWITMTSKRNMGVLGHIQSIKDMNYMVELFDAGKVKPIIDKVYPLSETAEAFRYLGEGHAKGKVVINVDQDN